MSLDKITKTGADIAATVKRQFGDESGVQLTDADILRWINNGQTEIVRKNKVLKARSRTGLVQNQAEYDVAALDIMQIESLHVNGTKVRHVEFAQAEQMIADFDQSQPTDTPQLWFEWGSLITLFPAPNLTVENGLTIYYTKNPAPLAVISDSLSLPDKYFEALVVWTMHKAFQMDEEFEAANNERQHFNVLLDESSEEEYTTAHVTYPVITIVE